MERGDFQRLASQLRDLQDANKNSAASLFERASGMGIDPSGLRRFVAWKRRDEAKRAEQEAIDQQCRYLAGERATPAELPIGCELAQALNLFRRNMTVRQVAEEMHISSGKAGKLRQLSQMFDVHVHATVDKIDPETGEITTAEPPGESDIEDATRRSPGAEDQAVDLTDHVALDEYRMRDSAGFVAMMESRGEPEMPAGLRRQKAVMA